MAAEVQAVAAEVIAGPAMQVWREWHRQQQGGAPAADGEPAPAGGLAGELYFRFCIFMDASGNLQDLLSLFISLGRL